MTANPPGNRVLDAVLDTFMARVDGLQVGRPPATDQRHQPLT